MESYRKNRDVIRARLGEFRKVLAESDDRIFAELCFCICTPQSKARLCWKTISTLMRNGLLYNGNEEEILPHMGGVRFAEKKVKYIVEARRFFTRDGSLLVKSVLPSFSNIESLRIWLVKNLKGIGMKEASHFLRNVGLGKDLAILDRHILRNLVELGILKGLPKNLTRKQYLEIEQKLRSYATMVGIPMDELDLLLWSQETGEVFK